MRQIIIREPGNDRKVKYTRDAARAIITEDDRVLMSHERKPDSWALPGGGVEDTESFEECYIREVGEETGKLVEIQEPFTAVTEYYDEACYTSRFFICKIVGDCRRRPTPGEISVDACPQWIRIDELLPILEEKIKTNAPCYRVHVREHRVLTEYIKSYN